MQLLAAVLEKKRGLFGILCTFIVVRYEQETLSWIVMIVMLPYMWDIVT